MNDAIETLMKELKFYKILTINANGVWFDEFAYESLLIRKNPETYSNIFSQYVKYLRFPTQDEWDYFFMCENIEDKDLQQRIIECYNYKHKVGQKLKQPCNPNFKKESWRNK